MHLTVEFKYSQTVRLAKPLSHSWVDSVIVLKWSNDITYVTSLYKNTSLSFKGKEKRLDSIPFSLHLEKKDMIRKIYQHGKRQNQQKSHSCIVSAVLTRQQPRHPGIHYQLASDKSLLLPRLMMMF